MVAAALWLAFAGWLGAAALLLDILPGAPRPLQWTTGAPIEETIQFEGGGQQIVADRYRPAGGGRHSGLIFAYGALREGRSYAPLVALGRSLARAGYTVLNPDLPDLPNEALTRASLEGLVAAIQLQARDPRGRGDRVGLFGFSLGGSLALVAAADPRVADQVAVVVDVGGYYRFQDMVQALTTGTVPDDHEQPIPFSIDPLAAQVALNSMVRLLAPDDQRVLLVALLAHPDAPQEALTAVDRRRLSPVGAGVLDLVLNRDPARVGVLYGALDPGLRATIEETMAPAAHPERIRAQVWALHDQNDPFVPSQQTRRLAQDARLRERAHVTFSTLLEHAELRARPLTPVNLWSVYLPNGWSLLRYVHGALAALA
jgi:dienelactone hydrolase